MSYVYFIFFPQETAYKIGKANCLKNRLFRLKQSWGEFCSNKSFALVVKDEDAFKIENFIHSMLNKYKHTPCKKEDGFTEFFKPPKKRINETVSHIERIFGEVTIIDELIPPSVEKKETVVFDIPPKSQFELTSMLMNLPTPDLKALEKLLLILLSDYGNKIGENIYPSLARLSEQACMSRRALIENLKKLESKGYIGIVRGGVIDKQNVTNSYVINMEKLGFEYDSKGHVISAKHLTIIK